MLFRSARILKEKFPNLKIYTTGINIMSKNFMQRLKSFSSYDDYLYNLILRYNLENNIIFLGSLNENEMCERFLKSHVFVSPSTIENSSNSIGEAMILGVPIVASYVGGTSSIMRDKVDGYLYPANEPRLLAEYIKRLFENEEIANKFSQNSRLNAFKLHSNSENFDQLKKIYNEIMKIK